jgi:hypothetical protein
MHEAAVSLNSLYAGLVWNILSNAPVDPSRAGS